MWIYILIAILILAALSVAVIYHDTHSFVVRNYEIPTDKVEGDYTFVLLSDLHGYTFGENNEKLISAVKDIAPDAVLCAGDMFTGHRINGEIQYGRGLHVLTEMAKFCPVYMGNGNHERKVKNLKYEYGNLFDRYRSMLQRAGVQVLENDSTWFSDKNIRITGLDLNLEYFRKVVKQKMEPGYVERLVGSPDKRAFQILIAHNPQYFDEYRSWGADLTVSGHVHGGIIRLPLLGGVISPSIALFPKYDGGRYEKDGKYMVLSRGLGTHSIHVRMFNPGEVSVIKICGR
jgi:hypothetical protein